MWAVVLVGAGTGRRFGGPKALLELGGLTLLERCARIFSDFPERVAVLRAEDQTVSLSGWKIVPGGSRRRDSVESGLAALDPAVEGVLIHDVARPLVPREVVDRVLEASRREGAAVPVVPVTDTIKRLDGNHIVQTLDRSSLGAVQTPQGFRLDRLRRAYREAPPHFDATDDAAIVESLGDTVVSVAGDARNLKITSPRDLTLAAWILEASDS